MRKKNILLPVSLFLITVAANGQKTIIVPGETNREIWSEASAGLKINKKLDFDYTYSARFSDKTNGYKLGFSDYGIQYKIISDLSIKVKARFTYEPTDTNEFKYYVDLGYNLQRKGFPLKADYRFRMEDSPKSFKYGRETYIRNRIGLSYNLSKIVDPFVQYELFYCLTGPLSKDISDHRIYGGLKWSLTKNLSVSTSYFFNQEVNDRIKNTRKGNTKISKPGNQHTLVLELGYNF